MKHISRIERFNANVLDFVTCSGEGSHHSGNSDERNPVLLSKAVAVHPESSTVMYFA